MFCVILRLSLLVAVLSHLGVLSQSSTDLQDYGNHWTSYYEKQCCISQRHLRHHKGRVDLIIPFSELFNSSVCLFHSYELKKESVILS